MSGDISIFGPPIESLLFIDTQDSFWPQELKNDFSVRRQAVTRRSLWNLFDELFRGFTSSAADITELGKRSAISSELAVDFYLTTADFLNADPHNRRLILYLPFEILPGNVLRSRDDALGMAAKRFTISYMAAWRQLLSVYEVRANFVDGDIFEPELSPSGQPMACRAVHLVPWLVQKGFLSGEEVLELFDEAVDDILQDSIADILPVLSDLSLISENDNRLRQATRPNIGVSVARRPKIILSRKEIGRNWLRRSDQEADDELKKIRMRSALDLSRGLPASRVAWERRERERLLIEAYASLFANAVVNNTLGRDETLYRLKAPYHRIITPAVITGVRMAIERMAEARFQDAQNIFRAHEESLEALSQGPDNVQDAISSILSYLFKLCIIDVSTFVKFGISIPRLDVLVSDSKNVVEREIVACALDLSLMQTNQYAAELLYPVVLFFGSRLKGYARHNADLDVAVFVRPGVDFSKRPQIQEALSRIFFNSRIDRKIVEFWTYQEEEMLKIRDLPDDDVTLADSTWVHLLFASVWVGQEDVIRELYAKLLLRFLLPAGKTADGRDLRTLWLREMEREVLQYRLLHNGYRRLYPKLGGIPSDRAEGMDPESVFWDSGYRQLASKLFIARVFLPQMNPVTTDLRP